VLRLATASVPSETGKGAQQAAPPIRAVGPQRPDRVLPYPLSRRATAWRQQRTGTERFRPTAGVIIAGTVEREPRWYWADSFARPGTLAESEHSGRIANCRRVVSRAVHWRAFEGAGSCRSPATMGAPPTPSRAGLGPLRSPGGRRD